MRLVTMETIVIQVSEPLDSVQRYEYTSQVTSFCDKSWGGPENKATRNTTRTLEWPVETEAMFPGLHPAFRCGRGPGISLYSCEHDGKNFQNALTAFHVIFNQQMCVYHYMYMYMCALVRVSEYMCQNVRCEDWVTKLSTVAGYLRLNRFLK